MTITFQICSRVPARGSLLITVISQLGNPSGALSAHSWNQQHIKVSHMVEEVAFPSNEHSSSPGREEPVKGSSGSHWWVQEKPHRQS